MICSRCGLTLYSYEEGNGICAVCVGPYPASSEGMSEWARANRLMCNFIHRGMEPPSVPLDPPVDE